MFLCTRVTKITVEEKAMLKSVLQSLKPIKNDKSRQNQSTMHLFKCQIWITPWPENPHRQWNVIFLQTCALQVQQTKREYKQIYWVQSRTYKLPLKTQHLDMSIYGSPRIWHQTDHIIPIKLNCEKNGEEQREIVQRELKAHRCAVFFVKDRVDINNM